MLTYLWLTRDDQCYEFAQASTAKYAEIIEMTAKSLHPITESERNSITQTILKVVQAQEGENISELSERTGNTLSLEYLALINNLSPSTPLRSTQWLKIGVEVPYQ